MKKILTVAFALLIVASMTLVTFAANGSFVSSPSTTQAPVLIEGKNDSSDCYATVVITAYADRTKLDEASANALVVAYNDIAGTEDLGALTPAIGELAEEIGLPTTDFAVSDLFDISYIGCDDHTAHGAFAITIEPASIENVAGVLHYNGSEWELLSFEIDEEDGHIIFVVDELSPFAIMVHTSPLPDDGNAAIWIAAVSVVAAAALIFIIIVIFRKKKKDEDEKKSENAAQ